MSFQASDRRYLDYAFKLSEFQRYIDNLSDEHYANMKYFYCKSFPNADDSIFEYQIWMADTSLWVIMDGARARRPTPSTLRACCIADWIRIWLKHEVQEAQKGPNPGKEQRVIPSRDPGSGVNDADRSFPPIRACKFDTKEREQEFGQHRCTERHTEGRHKVGGRAVGLDREQSSDADSDPLSYRRQGFKGIAGRRLDLERGPSPLTRDARPTFPPRRDFEDSTAYIAARTIPHSDEISKSGFSVRSSGGNRDIERTESP